MGNVSAKNIKAKNIVAGLQLKGATDDVVKAALKMADRFQSGDVTATETLEADNIVTGFQYINPKSPTRENFLKELESLRMMLAELSNKENLPEQIGEAVQSLDETIMVANKEKPVTKRIVSRLRESLEFITEAGDALESASNVGEIIAKAAIIGTGLMQMIQMVF